MRKLAASFIIFLLINKVNAQPPALLADFGVQQVNDKILVSWEINSGNQCLGLQVEHSSDSINFNSIYDYQGICGAGTTNEKYDYLHSTPVRNSTNYYRLKLGNGGYSSVQTIKFVKIEATGYTLFPNPVTINSKLYFNNTGSYTLTLFSSSGSEVYTKENIMDTEFSFNELFLKKGIYFFRLVTTSGSSKIQGKFVVQ